ncbi:MAG: PIN domain-containing protein [Nibricoccus sp.]
MDTPPFINHIFVDFENVHEVDLSLIGQKSFHITVLIGPKQTKLDAALVEKLLKHTDSAHLVRLKESGYNAVDFSLAYYVGRAAVLYPSAFFHIISKDTGYDPLVAHLRSNQVRAHRHADFASLKEMLNNGKSSTAPTEKPSPIPTPATPVPADTTIAKKKTSLPDERVARTLEHLQSHAKNRPAKETTLVHHILTILGKDATETNAKQVIHSLRAINKLSITDKGRVEYHV